MKRKKIVAGNWKMNLNLEEAIDLVKAVRSKAELNTEVERVFIPSCPFLVPVLENLKGRSDFFVGAQNCSEHDKGACTGEVSASMLQSIGCNYVLVGHSERRAYFSESNTQLVKKIERALEANLKVIFCFGELLQERKSNRHFQTVRTQLEEVLSHFPKDKLQHLVLAYEPVWAIGTGETASPEQAQEMHVFVRTIVAELFSKEAAESMSILYGGSCNAKNAKELFSCKDVDGGLIGGASLIADDFCTIINSFS
jgi:triosephosphate isomerase